MSDPNNPWMPDWQSMQKQMFSAWTDAARGGGGQMGMGGTSPIPEGFDVWMKLMGNTGGNPALDKVMGAAKQFTDFMQGVVGQVATKQPDFLNPAALRTAMEQAMGGLSKANNPVLSAFEGISAQGARGIEDLYKEFMKGAQPMMNEATAQLSTPAFGMQREQQERHQGLLKSMAEYNDKSSRFQALLYKASRVGMDKFESKMEERAEPGRQITSMRGLYDVFVDAAEEGYAEIALTDEFREAYGDMVNTQMRLRQRVQSEVERSSAALGMPSRTELDTVHKRMHEMRRQMADLREQLQDMGVASSSKPAAAPAPAATSVKPKSSAKRVPAAKAAVKPEVAVAQKSDIPSAAAPRASKRKRN